MRTNALLLIAGIALQLAPSIWAQVPEFGNPRTTTVSSAKDAADDSWVVLEGQIVRQIGGDKYLFRDPTGEIVVDIDHEHWRGVTASPETILRISGEVDREFLSTEIDVETVEKVESTKQGSGDLKGN